MTRHSDPPKLSLDIERATAAYPIALIAGFGIADCRDVGAKGGDSKQIRAFD